MESETKTVKAVLNMGWLDYPDHALREGQVADVPEHVAARMIRRGHAVEVAPQRGRGEAKPVTAKLGDREQITPTNPSRS